MAKNTLVRIPLFILFLFLISCSAVKPEFSNLMGNNSYRNGKYQKATVFYLNGLKSGVYKDFLYYNIGNVFYSLGEGDEALSVWEKAEHTDDPEILYRVCFNKGVLYYQLGQYEAAYQSFKTALDIKPGDKDSKINLELAYKKNTKVENTSMNQTSDSDKGLNDNSVRILQYVKRQEELFWSVNEEQEEWPQNDW